MPGTSDVANADDACVQPDSRAQGQGPLHRVKMHQTLLKQNRSATGALLVVWLVLGGVPDREDGIPDQVHNRATSLMNTRNAGLVIVVEQFDKIIRVHPLGDFGKIGDVAKQDAYGFLSRTGLEQLG